MTVLTPSRPPVRQLLRPPPGSPAGVPSGPPPAGAPSASPPTGAPRRAGGEHRPDRRRYAELDVLRFVAALAVVAFHYFFRASDGEPVLAHTGFANPGGVFHYGYLGVNLFFVISGFVILRSAWGKAPSAFVASRIGRLYPAFWVGCTLTAVVVAAVPFDRYDATFVQWLANLTMASETFDVPYVDGVYWTLVVELAFYLLVLCVGTRRLTTNRVVAFCLCWLAVSVAHEIRPLSETLMLVLIPEWAPYFVAGMLFALVARDGWRYRYALPLAAAYGWSVFRGVEFAAALTDKYDLRFSPLVVGAVVTAVFAAFVAVVSGVTLPRLHRLAWFGGLTYPLYLLHENIGYALFEAGNTVLGLNRWVTLAVVGATVGLLAWLLHVTVEQPCAAPFARWLLRVWAGLTDAARAGRRTAVHHWPHPTHHPVRSERHHLVPLFAMLR